MPRDISIRNVMKFKESFMINTNRTKSFKFLTGFYMIPLKHCEMSHHFSRAHCSYIKKSCCRFSNLDKRMKSVFLQAKKASDIFKQKKPKKTKAKTKINKR